MSNLKVNIISVQELKDRQAQDNSLCLIDVRELYEWQQGHIPGAKHIPKGEIMQRIQQEYPNKAQPIYLHCQAGVRSFDAAKSLLSLGYTEVYSIEGGLSAWAQHNYPIL